jgi:sugar transferase (PEP-CTERM system associated)
MLKIFKHHIAMWSVIELVADSVLCFSAVLLAATRLPDPSSSLHPQVMQPAEILVGAAGFSALMALLYSFVGLYRQGAVRVGFGALSGRGLLALAIGLGVTYFALQKESNRDIAITLLFYVAPVMALGLVAVRSLSYLARRSTVGARRVLIVGTGPEARAVADDLVAGGNSRHLLVGFYPTDLSEPAAASELPAPVFARALSIGDLVRSLRVDEVIVAVREQRGGGLPMDQLLDCRIRGVPVLDLTAFFERSKGEMPTDNLKASWLIYGHGFVQGGMRTAIKRAFDLLSSSLLLIVAAPVMILTAIAIRLESKGPIIYRQERIGLGGRPFTCLKFRSMRVDAENDGVARWASKNDSRVTAVGALIRKCRIDELPQLVSVLRGEMSLVGPRPERPAFVSQLKAAIPFYDIRHSVKPGVTGWAQVRYSYGASIEDARRKHQFDLYYVKNHSLFLDLLVLVETVSVVLFREGAQ